MKKFLIIFISIYVLVSFPSFADSKESEGLVEKAGNWSLENLTDEFGDPIGESALRADASGDFSNLETTSSELSVSIYYSMDDWNGGFRFKLLDDKQLPVVYTDLNNAQLLTKVEEIECYDIAGTPPNGDLYLCEGSDAILDHLLQGEDVRCIIKIEPSKYNFTINADGFASVYYSEQYKTADELYGQGAYKEAEEIFRGLGDFHDSEERVNQCEYTIAENLFGKQKYEEACKIFEGLGEYSDAKDRAEECVSAAIERDYNTAQSLFDSGEFEEAEKAFRALGDYSDAKDRAEECVSAAIERDYNTAQSLFDSGEFEEAEKAFLALGDYSDSKERAEDSKSAALKRNYNKAQAFFDVGQYDEAEEAFLALGDYSNAKERAEECKNIILERDYNVAQALYGKKQYKKAAEIFEALGDYLDSKTMAEKSKKAALEQDYKNAQTLFDNGEYEDAAEAFEALGDYLDAEEQAEACRTEDWKQKNNKIRNSYIIPNSDKEYVTEEMLDKLKLNQIRAARNEIYARHGYIFKSEDLKKWFGSQEWYNGTVSDISVIEAELNEIEWRNIEFMDKYEESHS